jgi:large subunit ribosomal protein L20
MGALKKRGSTLNRKMLAEIAARDFEGFKAIEQALR